MKIETLYATAKNWLTVKKQKGQSFCYVERRGLDSVAVVLVSEDDEYFGLINEAKPPFAEREGTSLPFKVSALGGSLFDMVKSDEEYLGMSESERIGVARVTAVKETKEESGYTAIDMKYTGKTFNNSMSNEYVYGFIVKVDKTEEPKPDPQTENEALASVVWVHNSELNTIQCGKAKAIILDYILDSEY